MKKTMKKNNKGFSLVELIVVVLIMAIIGVALAPQVMKWVGNARVSNDVQTQDAVVSAAQLALTSAGAMNIGEVRITISNSGCTIPAGNYKTAFDAILDSSTVKFKSGATATILVDTDAGKVKVESSSLSNTDLGVTPIAATPTPRS